MEICAVLKFLAPQFIVFPANAADLDRTVLLFRRLLSIAHMLQLENPVTGSAWITLTGSKAIQLTHKLLLVRTLNSWMLQLGECTMPVFYAIPLLEEMRIDYLKVRHEGY